MSTPSAARAARSAVHDDVAAAVAAARSPRLAPHELKALAIELAAALPPHRPAANTDASRRAADELETALQMLGWLSAQFVAMQGLIADPGPVFPAVRLEQLTRLAELGQFVAQQGENTIACALAALREVAA